MARRTRVDALEGATDLAFLLMLGLMVMLFVEQKKSKGTPLLTRQLPVATKGVAVPVHIAPLHVGVRVERGDDDRRPALIETRVDCKGARPIRLEGARLDAHWEGHAKAFGDEVHTALWACHKARQWGGQALILEVNPGAPFDFAHHVVEAYRRFAQEAGVAPQLSYRVRR